MFKPKMLLLLLTSVTWPVQADFFEGISAYGHQNFKTAQQEFSALLPLGDGAAVFNLAIMAYQGQGETADAIKTAAMAEKLTAALDQSQQHALMRHSVVIYSAKRQIIPF